MTDDGAHILAHSRDFFPTGVHPDLDEAKLATDLKIMARLRLCAQDAMGIQVCSINFLITRSVLRGCYMPDAHSLHLS